MQSYVDPILEGIPGPLRNVFSPANFILEDIRQNAKKVTGSEDEAGVYMIVVADFKKGSTYEDKHTHIYIGKTIHFEQRLREHRNATRSKQAVHRA
ncbi:Excinuclease ABC C subunit [Macrophomina phaseolina MS6]|uniref:Excinuclease ABC C subunit n=2 Tax=Macrophomina phaseolina TaxID=35725 RepID=K2RMD7_MACPH|nr:Excinuclease ABC C subunit [Macrophomina phaseolina MS6]